MNQNQINKFRMGSSVDLALDNHSTLFTESAELVTVHQRLKEQLNQISQLRQIQEADTSGLTQNKSDLRQRLTQRIAQLSAALVAHATTTRNAELKTKATYSKTKLAQAADPVLYDIGVLLVALATPLKEALAKYFVTEAEFAEVNSLLSEFKLSIPKRRVATNISKVSTSNIGDMVDAMIKLLNEEIDVLMEPFLYPQPDFYKAYKNARKIVGYHGRGRSKDEEGNEQPQS